MAADLHMLLICGLKFSLSYNWIHKSSTEGTVLICLLSIRTFSFVWSPFFLFIIITWNLSGFTIIWFFWNQSFITSDSLCKILINFDTFSAKADNVSSSAKLCTSATFRHFYTRAVDTWGSPILQENASKMLNSLQYLIIYCSVIAL